MILLDKLITKALISLRGCAGWSAPVLFANSRRQVFLRQGPIIENGVDSDQMVSEKPADFGSVVECLTRDRRAAGSSLTGVTALLSLSKTHLS